MHSTIWMLLWRESREWMYLCHMRSIWKHLLFRRLQMWSMLFTEFWEQSRVFSFLSSMFVYTFWTLLKGKQDGYSFFTQCRQLSQIRRNRSNILCKISQSTIKKIHRVRSMSGSLLSLSFVVLFWGRTLVK